MSILVKQSNRNFNIQFQKHNQILINIKNTNTLQEVFTLNFLCKTEIKEIINLYKQGNITLPTFIYILLKNNALVANSLDKQKTLQLLVQRALESGLYNPVQFYSKF